MFSFIQEINKLFAEDQKVEKATLVKVTKAKATIAKEAFKVILPGDKVLSKKEVKAKDAVNIIYDLLKQAKYVDNVKADTLRKLMLFLDEDTNIKSAEKALIEWLKADTGVKVVKNLKVTVTKN